MSNQHVMIDGKRLGIWFQHVNLAKVEYSEDQKAWHDAANKVQHGWTNAIGLGQVKRHHNGSGELFNAVTRCQLEDEDRNIVAVGYAFCSSQDNFSKARGRNISLARAIEWAKR